MKRHGSASACAVAFLGIGLAFIPLADSRAVDPARPAGIRVVNCGQSVQSAKRGVCANSLSDADFHALAPGVSWFYNWHFEPKSSVPAGVAIEFLPMVWGNRPQDLAGLQSYLARTPRRPRAVLAINEPNLKGQAFITPQQTASLYRQTREIADRYGIPTVGPHMALGSSEHESIRAMDPLQNKEVTYTFMVPFLEAFLHFMGSAPAPSMAFHSYGTLGEMKWAVGMMHEKFNRPIWVTEYAQWKSGNPEEARKYLMQATDFLERCPYVAGYAWFKERVERNPNISLFAAGSGILTPLGQTYVAMPVHDADVYYRLPGRLQAANYAATDGMEIEPVHDTDGFAFMGSEAAQGWLEYNVQVDMAGTYTLKFRVGGPAGKLEILKGAVVSATLQTDGQTGWQTIETSLDFAAGPQKLRVRCGAGNQAINWIEFVRK